MVHEFGDLVKHAKAKIHTFLYHSALKLSANQNQLASYPVFVKYGNSKGQKAELIGLLLNCFVPLQSNILKLNARLDIGLCLLSLL